jgi:DNA-binding NtrC family response regulator
MSLQEKPSILIVDDLQEYLHSLEHILKQDYAVSAAVSLDQAKEKMAHERVDIALIDVRLNESDQSNRDGLLLLKWIKEHHPAISVVMMSAYRDFDHAVDALNMGADRFLKKPIEITELKKTLAELVTVEVRSKNQ